MMWRLGTRDLPSPLSLGRSCVASGQGGGAHFEWKAQKTIAIASIVIRPTIGAANPDLTVGVEIVKCRPETAKIVRFKDGSTISDQGISSVTYAMRSTSEDAFVYRTPIPTEEDMEPGSDWFAEGGIGYLIAKTDDRVVVHVGNYSKEDVEVSGVILYRDIAP